MTPTEVDVGRGEVVETFVVAVRVVVVDGLGQTRLELAWQVLVLEQDLFLHRAVVAFDLAPWISKGVIRVSRLESQRRENARNMSLARLLVRKSPPRARYLRLPQEFTPVRFAQGALPFSFTNTPDAADALARGYGRDEKKGSTSRRGVSLEMPIGEEGDCRVPRRTSTRRCG